MYVACSTLCFARQPLERALRLINDLHFSKVDIAIHENGPHLRPSEVLKDVSLAGQRIRIGPSLTPAAFNVEIAAAEPDEFLKQLRAICRLARQSAVSILTLPAGPRDRGLDAEVARLTPLVRMAETEGIVLTVSTTVGTVTELPEAAVQLCQRVPGLGLTLDPSHYLVGPNQGGAFEDVFPYVRHVHLRDTGRTPEQFQVKIGQGEIEYGKIISHLTRYGYERLLTVDIRDFPEVPFVMESEVRKLKFLLESLV